MGLFDYLGGLFGNASESGGRWTGGETNDGAADGAESLGQVAEAFAAEHADREFDFTVASLDRLDTFVARVVADESVPDPDDASTEGELPGEPVLSLGSYFGEVLVRQFDGEWHHREDVRVVVPAGSTNVAVRPFDVVTVAFRRDPQFARAAEQLRERVGDREAEEPGLELDLGDEEGTGEAGDEDRATADTADGESADEAAPRFPTVDLAGGMDLDTAHERTLETFERAGYRVTAGDLLNSMPDNPVEGVAKLFLFYSATEMYTGVVYVGDWDESDTEAVISLARYLQADDDLDGLHVVSAAEPPPAVTYLTTTHTRSAFALDALRESADVPAFSAESAPAFADRGADLLARYADGRIDRTDTGTLARLDDFVLDVLRPVADPAEPHEGYVPREALLVIGSLAGEVMRHGLERELPVTVTWGTDEEIASTGVVLQITTADADGALTVNPVGKAFKLFRSGESESLAGLYETCLQVVEREVADATSGRGGDGRA